MFFVGCFVLKLEVLQGNFALQMCDPKKSIGRINIGSKSLFFFERFCFVCRDFGRDNQSLFFCWFPLPSPTKN